MPLNEIKDNVEMYYNFNNRIPFHLLQEEYDIGSTYLKNELAEITKYYKIYYKGAEFATEGSSGDYVASQIRYRTAAQLINKEARFLFSETPDMLVNYGGDVEQISDQDKSAIEIFQKLVDNVLKKNMFSKTLLQAAKDCFIGKRIAGILNFNEEEGITLTFLDAFSFVYKVNPNNPEQLDKFVSFTVQTDSKNLKEKRIFKKKYVRENDGIVYFEDTLYDGTGVLIEVINEYQATKLKDIPAAVFLNDGLLADEYGESEIAQLEDAESLYSKLSNADVDAERKGMNQIRYVVDMNPATTKNLSSSPGSFWDLGSDQNAENCHPEVGTLSTSLDYSTALKSTLDRVKSSMFDQMEVPDITPENISGIITSGKGLKAIYWPLLVRCKEKMKVWGPKLEYLIDSLIKGAIAYPNCCKKYIGDESIIPVAYEISIVQNTPLLEDENEEKQNDLAEVNYNVRSKKSYMQKWMNLTDSEVESELQQMAKEREILEDAATFGGMFGEQV